VPTALTVTATQGGSTANGILLRVYVLTGASATQNGATAATYFTPATLTFTQAITTTATGSRVYGAGSTSRPTEAATAVALTTVVDDVQDSTNTERLVTFKATSLTGTPGSTTLGWTISPSTGVGPQAMAEIMSAGTLQEDPSAPAAVSDLAATTVTTASFTPPDGALLVACVSSDGGGSVTTMGVSGGGVTWSELARNPAVAGQDYAGVWVAQLGPPPPGDPVITATQGGVTAAGIAMRIMVLTGAAPAASQTGATVAAASARQASITTTVTGSRVYGASDGTNVAATPNASTTTIDDIADATHGERYQTFKATALTGTPGAVTIGNTNAGGTGVALLEVLAAGTLTEDASAPAVASDTTQTFVSCLNFTPPPGSLLVIMISSDGGSGVTTMSVSGGGLTFIEKVAQHLSSGDYCGVWIADVPAAYAPEPVQLYAPGWHPGRGLPGLPAGIPFDAPPEGSPPAAVAAAAAAAAAPPPPAPPRRPGPHRASLGARGLLAAGILAAGIGPPAVPAPHQPPVITHPAPHRSQWRAGQGTAPNAAQQVKRPVPVTVYSRSPHAAIWRGGRGAVPAALPPPFRPATVFARKPHGALWRGGAGPVPAAVQGGGTAQPFRPPTVYRRTPHGGAWRTGQGVPPAARPQPFRPVTVYPRAAHRVLWRGGQGPVPVSAPSLGTPPPFRPVTVYPRRPHGAIWRTVAGRVAAAAAQPFKPATVYRRARHGAVWRAATGRPPAAARQPRTPATVFTRAAHRSLWHGGLGSPAPPPPAFTVGALTAGDAPTATQTPRDRATSAATASTAAPAVLTAGDQRTGGPG